MATPLGCKNVVSPSNQVAVQAVKQTDKLYSLGSIPFLLIARTLYLSKLIYGQTCRLFGQQMSSDCYICLCQSLWCM